jgi:hypothetical protein
MHDIRTMETDAIVVGFHEDVRPLKGGAGVLDWVLCGSLSRLIIEGRIRGALGEVALLTTAGKLPSKMVFMIGLGRREGMTQGDLRTAARTVATSLTGAGIARAAVDLLPPGTAQDRGEVDAVRQGLAEGAGGRDLQITLLASDAAAYERISRFV